MSLDSSLDRDPRLDSLARIELLTRSQARFGIALSLRMPGRRSTTVPYKWVNMQKQRSATDMADTGINQELLVSALRDPAVYDHPVERVETLETHISYVFLAGAYAYKIKKSVDLGFLNFRTLEARRFYCAEELRLNRRLAPALYLDVVSITGSPERPVLGGDGPAIEYAVKMRRFAQEHLLGAMIARNALTPSHVDRLADKIAGFHATAAAAGAHDAFGIPDAIARPAMENFAQIRAVGGAASDPVRLEALEKWTAGQLRALDDVFRSRKAGGFVRECHGDFHLGNAALVDGEVAIFDCIEFNADFRWIDVMSEIAFLYMDLQDKRRPDLAQRFLNRYLETTGDYAGVQVLRFYAAYRALVRAKIHWLRAHQPHVSAPEQARLLAQYRGYLDIAAKQTQPPRPAIILTHGLSGSGKTTHSQSLLEIAGAVRVRSDVERKRLLGLPALAATGAGVHEGAYAADVTRLTYGRLLDLAKTTADAGHPVVVDATFLQRAQRDAFRRLARTRGLPFVIVDFVADEPTLRARIDERQRTRHDASEADIRVFEHQLETQEPLQPDELSAVVAYDSGTPPANADRRAAWTEVLRRLEPAST